MSIAEHQELGVWRLKGIFPSCPRVLQCQERTLAMDGYCGGWLQSVIDLPLSTFQTAANNAACNNKYFGLQMRLASEEGGGGV